VADDAGDALVKVLYVINTLGTGGAERSLAEMLPGLANGGVDPVVAYLYPREHGVEAEIRGRGFRVVRLDADTFPGRVRELRALIARERPHLLHTTILESSLMGRIAALRTPTPVLTSLVNILYSEGRLSDPHLRRWRVGVVRAVDAFTSRYLTDHFHAITGAVRREAAATMRIPPGRITVIERGRDPNRLGRSSPERRARVRRLLGLSEDAEILISVGRQEYQKGHRTLLRALDFLADRPRLILLHAGRPGQETALLERMQRGLGDNRVRFLGYREDLPDIMAGADLFVFPSMWEGLGGALIEAMALELPIVASRLDPVAEVVNEGVNALLVPPGEAAALARAIADLLDSPYQRREFGRSGRERFERLFTLDRSTRRMLDLYRRLVPVSGTLLDSDARRLDR
jgi:glycosyltransferase involved in cell wall biosynthesis